MSARDAWQVVLDSLMETIGAHDDDGPTQLIEAMHNNVMAMPDAERIALARALVPPGWVVGKVPPPHVIQIGDDGSDEYDEGFNACRAAFIKSGEETT